MAHTAEHDWGWSRELTAADYVCMNPRRRTCVGCIFENRRECPPAERLAKAALDEERSSSEVAA